MEETEKKVVRRFDLVTSILLILGSIWFLFQCKNLFFNPFGKKVVSEKELADITAKWFESPALFPVLVGILLLVAGIALLIIALKDGARFDFFTKEKIKSLGKNREFITFIIVAGSLAIYIYALIPFCRAFLNILPYSFQGFPFMVATFIFISEISIIFQRERTRKNVLISLLVAFIASLVIALMFNKGALIPLP